MRITVISGKRLLRPPAFTFLLPKQLLTLTPKKKRKKGTELTRIKYKTAVNSSDNFLRSGGNKPLKGQRTSIS